MARGKKGGGHKAVSVATIGAVVTATQVGGDSPTDDVIKKGWKDLKMDADDHVNGYSRMDPLLSMFKELNPGFDYVIGKDADGHFQHVAIMLPYAQQAAELGYMYNLLGLDGAHFKDIVIQQRGATDEQPRKLLKKNTLSVISSRAPNMSILILGFIVSFSENSADIDVLLRLFAKNGLILDDSRYVLLTDRGSALIKTAESYLSKAFHFLCGKHLSENVKAHGGGVGSVSSFWKARNATTQVAYEAVMKEMAEKNRKCHSYLVDIEEKWQLYRAIDANAKIYQTQSSNLVEQVMSLLLEARFESPYFFLVNALTKICSRMSDERSKANEQKDNTSVLTPYAHEIFRAREKDCLSRKFRVQIIDGRTGSANVTSVLESVSSAKIYRVELSQKSCSCSIYQQSGDPCIHAHAVIRDMKLPVQDIFSDAYFDRLSFRRTWIQLYELPSTRCKMPGDDEVSRRQHELESDPTYVPVKVVIVADNTKSLTSKRIASSGESAGGGTVSAKRAKGEAIACPHCTKLLSVRTRHGSAACAKHAKKYGIPEVEIIHIPRHSSLPSSSSSSSSSPSLPTPHGPFTTPLPDFHMNEEDKREVFIYTTDCHDPVAEL